MEIKLIQLYYFFAIKNGGKISQQFLNYLIYKSDELHKFKYGFGISGDLERDFEVIGKVDIEDLKEFSEAELETLENTYETFKDLKDKF